MIKTVWDGLLFTGRRTPFIEVLNGEYIKLQGTGTGTFTLYGVLGDDTKPSPIGLIRAKDLLRRKQGITDDVYMGDVSGYKYVYVVSSGFKKIYGKIYGIEDSGGDVEHDVIEYETIVILDTYSSLIRIEGL